MESKYPLVSFALRFIEGVSGVPAQKIRDLAREVALGRPSCIISYRGAVTHAYGVETERAIQMLAAITGNVDNPGGRCKAVGAKWKYPKGPKRKPVPTPVVGSKASTVSASPPVRRTIGTVPYFRLYIWFKPQGS